MKIGNRIIGAGTLFFGVEEGVANLGSFEKALSMIDAAAATGADAIEFQLLRARDFCVRTDARYDFYQTLEFSDGQLRELVQYARSKELEFVAAALTHTLIGTLADAGCSAFNVNASDLTNPQILDCVAQSGLPFFLSLLMAAPAEIDWAVNRVTTAGAREFCLLHGQHTMFTSDGGVAVHDTALGYLSELRRQYRIPVGFIDHTPLPWMPAVAVAAGADVVTKHLALNRADRGPDYQICLEPGEMSTAVQWARQVKESMGATGKRLAPGEEADLHIMRKSIVAAGALKEGHVLRREDLAFKRPGSGISPTLIDAIVGSVTTRNIDMDQLISFADVREKANTAL
jgi:sialic acid synthase SpsE